jgi:hypothetical protein
MRVCKIAVWGNLVIPSLLENWSNDQHILCFCRIEPKVQYRVYKSPSLDPHPHPTEDSSHFAILIIWLLSHIYT